MTPEHWDTLALGDVATLSSGTTPPRVRSELFCTPGAGGIPWVKTLDLTDRWIDGTKEYVTASALNAVRLRTNKPGTVLVAMYGGFQQIGRSGILRVSATTNQAICAIDLFHSRVIPEFCNYWLVYVRPRWRNIAASSRKDPNITKEDVRRFPILVPPLAEQRKIAAVLSSVDDAIEATQAVIDQIHVVKKAMMAELLTQGLPGRHIRFKQTEIGDVPESWTVCRVEDVGAVDAGKARDPGASGTPRPYLRVANVFDGQIRTDDVNEMPFTDREFERFALSSGDVLLNEGQSLDLVGRCSTYRGELGRPAAFQNALLRFRSTGPVLAEFAEHYFRWCQRSGRFAKIATQTTSIAHLGLRRFAEMSMHVPPVQEQQAIADVLSGLDAKSRAEQRVADQLARTKSALMSVLLTGEARVTPDQAAA